MEQDRNIWIGDIMLLSGDRIAIASNTVMDGEDKRVGIHPKLYGGGVGKLPPADSFLNDISLEEAIAARNRFAEEMRKFGVSPAMLARHMFGPQHGADD